MGEIKEIVGRPDNALRLFLPMAMSGAILRLGYVITVPRSRSSLIVLFKLEMPQLAFVAKLSQGSSCNPATSKSLEDNTD